MISALGCCTAAPGSNPGPASLGEPSKLSCSDEEIFGGAHNDCRMNERLVLYDIENLSAVKNLLTDRQKR